MIYIYRIFQYLYAYVLSKIILKFPCIHHFFTQRNYLRITKANFQKLLGRTMNRISGWHVEVKEQDSDGYTYSCSLPQSSGDDFKIESRQVYDEPEEARAEAEKEINEFDDGY